MRKRLQKFQCRTITPIVRNMDVLYRAQAMEIIHWMTEELQVLIEFYYYYIVSDKYFNVWQVK